MDEQMDSPSLITTSLSLMTTSGSKSNQIMGVCLVTSEISMNTKSDIQPSKLLSTISIICPPIGGCGLPTDFLEFMKSRNVSVDVTSTERSLLLLLFSKISQLDPDIIVGHDLFEYTFKFLIHYSSVQKITIWSKIGRLKQTTIPHSTKLHGGVPIHVGRLVVELKSITEELIKLPSYDLNELCKEILHKDRENLDWADINHYFTKSTLLYNLIQNSMKDAFYCLQIMDEMSIIPLFKQISTICGHPISRSLTLGRAERIEYLLLHGYTENGCVCPDKNIKSNVKNVSDNSYIQEENTKRKSAYDGGLVLEPKSGLYPNFVLLLDYMSLYPSLIQEFNICFTTMKFVQKNNDTVAVPVEMNELQGILPREIKKLVDKRRQVKSLMNSCKIGTVDYIQYEIRQRALKLIANSIYGCLGYVNSRFYARPLAAFITSKGRELLGCTRDLVENLGYDVIYGDTDSIMVNTKIDDINKIKEISHKIMGVVNKTYKFLKIELDGIFKPILLLKKKKYAAVNVTINPDGSLSTLKELKGLDIVRHDWSSIGKESGDCILDMILSLTNHDTLIEKIHEFLTNLNIKLNENLIEKKKFVIRKKLTKKLEEYVEKKSHPHLLVAQRLISAGKKITVGDTIEYVICIDGSNKPHTQRAYHLSELSKLEYAIDLKYYKEGQILPIVSRLCQYVEGLESDVISRFLEIESHKRAVDTYQPRFLNENIEPLVLRCESCSKEWAVESLITDTNPYGHCMICDDCKSEITSSMVCNSVDKLIYKHCREFYQNVFVCSEQTCVQMVASLSLSDHASDYSCVCRQGQLRTKYSPEKLYNQFKYLRNIFDFEKLKQRFPTRLQTINSVINKFGQNFDYLSNKLEFIMDHNDYGYIDLSEIFHGRV